MWYLPVLIVVLAAGTAFGFSRIRNSKQPADIGTGIRSTVSLSMDEIGLLLAVLEKEEAPDPVMGAMCYAPTSEPESAEYICPVCGEKTVYNNYQTWFLGRELYEARRLAELIDDSTEFSVVLDETLYCDYCSEEDGTDPSLVLRVTNDDGLETANRVTLTDLRMLDSFLQGRLYWVTSNDGQQPLREHGERMAELLGI